VSVPLARVSRSGVVEAVHLGSVAVCDADGRLVAWAGDPAMVTYARSCTKPYQAAASLSLIGDGSSSEQVAVMCASHNAEEEHLDVVRGILDLADLDASALRCPPAWPLDPARAREVAEARPEYHDCSGKHAGMLLACVRAGLDPSTYQEATHPLQALVGQVLERGTGAAAVGVGVDGCGVPVHAFPLTGLATAYARLTRPETLGEAAPDAERALASMLAHPYLVAGRDRMCTQIMEAVPGVVVKVGAEGLVCAAVVEHGLGIALKVADGTSRARGPALVRVMRDLGAAAAEQEEALAAVARPPVLGGGRQVGEVTSDLRLDRT